MMMRLHVLAFRMLLVLGLAITSLGGYLVWIQATGNFATVVAGEVYRSNQPTPERLAGYARDQGIKSVLNLRGANPGADWYEAERQAAATLGLTLIDYAISAGEELDKRQVAELLGLLRDAPKPLLIHCRSGADRTGLASVMYQSMIAGLPENSAEGQLSLRYGHFAVPVLSAAWPMDTTWEKIEEWWDGTLNRR